jgi:formate hydrogenlyase transcriptional activator
MSFSEDSTMQIRAEDPLHLGGERIRLVLDSAMEAICGCDSEGTCLFSNPSAARILGYGDPAELLGKNMHALEHHTRRDGTPYPIEECPIYLGFQKGEGVHRDDEIFWRKDGTSFPVEYWSHPVVREGKTLGAVITFIDITQRKRAEAALHKSEERSRRLIQINNAIITNLTQEALLRAISEALHRFISFDRCAITLYQPETDTFRFLAVEGDLRSDTTSERVWRPIATRRASTGCSSISALFSAAISRKSTSMRMSAASPQKVSSRCAPYPWFFRGSVSARSAW